MLPQINILLKGYSFKIKDQMLDQLRLMEAMYSLELPTDRPTMMQLGRYLAISMSQFSKKNLSLPWKMDLMIRMIPHGKSMDSYWNLIRKSLKLKVFKILDLYSYLKHVLKEKWFAMFICSCIHVVEALKKVSSKMELDTGANMLPLTKT